MFHFCKVQKHSQKLMRQIDLFGVSINIRFNEQDKHKTTFGGMFTIFLMTIMVILTFNISSQIFNKINPNVLMEERLTPSPGRIELSKDNFTFMVGLYNRFSYQAFIDPSYFTIEANFLYKVKNTDSTGKIISTFQEKAVKMIQCNQNSFQVKNTEEYFLSLDYSNMLCLDYSNEIYLEGQFDANEFSVIQIFVKKCKGSSCKDEKELQKMLSETYIQLYYTNSIIQPSNYENPFQSVGQTQFWDTNTELTQSINMQYMNTHLIDKTGVFEQDSQEQKQLIFSQDRLLLQSKSENLYFISIFLEKNKEKYYFRSYMNIKEALTQIGGIFNILFLIGSIICQPYSRMQLERKLMNSMFSFPQKQKEAKIDYPTEKNDVVINQSSVLKKDDLFSGSSLVQSKSKSLQNSQNMQASEKDDIIKRIFSNKFEEAKVRTKEFFLLILQSFSNKKSEYCEMLFLGKEKVFKYTDISFIINKLIEIEKFKHLILENDQVKLFEFIPKPKLKLMYTLIKENNSPIKSLNRSIFDKIYESQQPKQQEINIMSIEYKNMEQKALEAQQAFNQIYKSKKQQNKVDKKLIQMLDQDLINYLQNQNMDTSMIPNKNNFNQSPNDKNQMSCERIKGETSQFKQIALEDKQKSLEDSQKSQKEKQKASEVKQNTQENKVQPNYLFSTENFSDKRKQELESISNPFLTLTHLGDINEANQYSNTAQIINHTQAFNSKKK